mmetsp:Transcript_93157/g.266170  ORF Transcript_93157/g.266170 Transcript_93157/m.266170 type:complete len:240 (+) Transcript_93157:200-919(+)
MRRATSSAFLPETGKDLLRNMSFSTAPVSFDRSDDACSRATSSALLPPTFSPRSRSCSLSATTVRSDGGASAAARLGATLLLLALGAAVACAATAFAYNRRPFAGSSLGAWNSTSTKTRRWSVKMQESNVLWWIEPRSGRSSGGVNTSSGFRSAAAAAATGPPPPLPPPPLCSAAPPSSTDRREPPSVFRPSVTPHQAVLAPDGVTCGSSSSSSSSSPPPILSSLKQSSHTRSGFFGSI